MADRWEQIGQGGESFRAFTAMPDGPPPLPAVVVIQHAGGVDRFVQDICHRLAAAGYYAIAPELYHRQDLTRREDNLTRVGRLRDGELIQDVNAAVDFLLANSAVRRDRIGIVGFCMGGRVVYLVATVNPAFRAAVAFYGGNTGIAWGEGTPPFQRLAQTHCPILGFFGEEDANPSPENARELDAELTRLGKEHEFHSFPNAGHAYMDFTNPTRYRPAAAEPSWRITLEFLDRRLRGRPGQG